MKTTIRDVAAAAGVSTATVDRVLHNRRGVSAVARQRVLKHARRLGYTGEEGSHPMPARPARLEFLIPVGSNEFLADLADRIEDFASRLPLVAACRVHRIESMGPRQLWERAGAVSTDTIGVGVVAADHPRTREVLNDLSRCGTRIVTIASDIPQTLRAAYIGVDNRAAGRTAGLMMARLLRADGAKVAVFLGSRSYRGHEERDMGFRSILTEEFTGLSVLPPIENRDENAVSYEAMRALLHDTPGLSGVYCVGGGREGIARALIEGDRAAEVVYICHDITRESREFLVSGVADVVIDQNSRLVSEQSVIALLGSIASSEPALRHKFIEPRIIMRENIPLM